MAPAVNRAECGNGGRTACGKQAVVTLKIRITTDGRVADVQVVDGEEPFTATAVDTLKKWRYTPASYQGKAISVYRVIKIAFQLS